MAEGSAGRGQIVRMWQPNGAVVAFNLKGTIGTPGPPTVTDPDVNDAWLDSNGNVWVWTGTEWVNMGPIAGADGSDGAQGPEGPQGAPGPAGATGPAGADGPAGPEGPEGPEGPAGPEGPQGVPGDAGDWQGSIDGGSPGEMFLQNYPIDGGTP